MPGGRVRKRGHCRREGQSQRRPQPSRRRAREKTSRGEGRGAPAPPVPPVHHLAPPHACATPGKPRPHRGWAGSERAFPPVTHPSPQETGSARPRSACSRTSLGFGCVGLAARPLPPSPLPPSPRSRFAGRRLRGLGPGPAAAIAGMPRVYIGRLSYQARERDVERFFKGYGKILEVDLKNG